MITGQRLKRFQRVFHQQKGSLSTFRHGKTFRFGHYDGRAFLQHLRNKTPRIVMVSFERDECVSLRRYTRIRYKRRDFRLGTGGNQFCLHNFRNFTKRKIKLHTVYFSLNKKSSGGQNRAVMLFKIHLIRLDAF